MSGPDVWGPHGWKFLHYVTLGYPSNPTNEDIILYKGFINHFKETIPCSICKNHFKEHLIKFPLTDMIMKDRMLFIEWGIHMHNMVNILNKKKVYTLDEGIEDMKKYSKECNGNDLLNDKENFTNNSIIDYSLIIFLVIVIIISLIYIKKKYY